MRLDLGFTISDLDLSAGRSHALVRNPQFAICNPNALRHGISLMEVLISMFVLLFGLMGVAAIFPVGN